MSTNMMERMMDCESMAMTPMMWFGMLLLMLLMVLLCVALMKWLMGQGGASREDSALDILNKRYARGVIDRQEFEERKRDLLT